VARELTADGWPVLHHRVGEEAPEEVTAVVFSVITSRLT
jgi:hypothetical protein